MSGRYGRSFLCSFGLCSSSLSPVSNRSTPKSFFDDSISKFLLNSEKIAALIHPVIIAGRTVFIFSWPCRQRKNDATIALGIKNSKLIDLAMPWGSPTTSESQSIRRLPPPTPRPERKPSTQPTVSITGNVFSIDIEPRPKE